MKISKILPALVAMAAFFAPVAMADYAAGMGQTLPEAILDASRVAEIKCAPQNQVGPRRADPHGPQGFAIPQNQVGPRQAEEVGIVVKDWGIRGSMTRSHGYLVYIQYECR